MSELLQLRRPRTSSSTKQSESATSTSEASVWVVTSSNELWLVHADAGAAPQRLATPFAIDVIRAAAGGSLWALERGTARLWCWSPDTSWIAQDLKGSRLSAGPENQAWIVGEDGTVQISSRSGRARPERLPAKVRVRDISVGFDGALWVVTDVRRGSGYTVQHRDAHSEDWFELPEPATAVAIAASPEGYGWAVNGHGAVWVLHPRGVGNMPLCVQDPDCRRCRRSEGISGVLEVSVGSDGSAWAATGLGDVDPGLYFRDAGPSDTFRPVSFAQRPRSVASAFAGVAATTGA